MIDLLPTFNAILNFTSSVFLFLGREKIREENKAQRKTMMLSAFLLPYCFSYRTSPIIHCVV